MDISASTESEGDGPVCVICNDSGDTTTFVKLGVKGCNGLIEASRIKGQCMAVQPGQHVHKECRKRFCHPNIHRSVLRTHNSVCQRSRRSKETTKFDFKHKCLFCGTTAKIGTRKRGCDVFPVATSEFQNTIRYFCTTRKDAWSESVLGRLEYGQDLRAINAIYHQSCSSNFRTGRSIPMQFNIHDTTALKKGRRSNSIANESFEQIIQYLEDHEDDQITVTDLVSKMHEICGEHAYSSVYMKKKLMDHFGCEIVISEINGMSNVITFKSNAYSILHSVHRKSAKSSTESSEKSDVIKTAAKLILEDIKALDFSTDNYPTSDEMASIDSNRKYVPSSILLFLQQLITSKNSDAKVIAMAQCIVQNTSPRGGILPLQLGLGVQMHHHFGSKFLIDTLNSLGFCSSYSEVQKYEAAAATKWNIQLDKCQDDQTVQFVADNVDHNLATIDGHNTFHGMGIIAAITPGAKYSRQVPRISATNEDVLAIGRINIRYYSKQNNNFDTIQFQSLSVIPEVEDKTQILEFLANIAKPLRLRIPSWSGFMQSVQRGKFPGKSSVLFLPMIDLNPGDLTCIYTTLEFVALQAKKLSVSPIITFDQPLYWKALQMIINEPEDSNLKSTVVRLCAFHTQMCFLGCIGYIMQNSGLQELIENVYAPNTVSHMLSGKAVSRAVRGHILVDDALNTIILEKMFPLLVPNEPGANTETDVNNNSPDAVQDVQTVENLKSVLEAIHSGASTIESVRDNEYLLDTLSRYRNIRSSLEYSRTARLWIQYMDMVDILKQFIKAERTGNWQLHLFTMKEMLPYFAAAGHHMYLKSGYIYLHQMASLQITHPQIYTSFMNGQHVIRRSDRFWAGLSTDLVIEQALMRSVKCTGGMTRGHGMSELQRAQWLLSMPACSDINNSMQEFTGQSYETSEQHKDTFNSRISRDIADSDKFVAFLRDRDPFTEERSLRNIETGSIAEENVNVDTACIIGKRILEEMESQNIINFSFKRSSKAITMGSKNAVKVGDVEIHVDPQLLFQRLMTVSDTSLDNPLDVFKYELCSHPASLFEDSGLMREAQKPSLANAIWESGQRSGELPTDNISYVLDGGSLIHRIPWKNGATFHDICYNYCKLVLRLYGRAIVVFDGYGNSPTTKDQTHERRSKGIKGTKTLFDTTTPFKTKKELFLSNTDNKQNFINMLSMHLSESGCRVNHSLGDADLLIVKTATKQAEHSQVAVIGEDTDLLVLLCFYTPLTGNNIYFTSDSKASVKCKKIWDIQNTKITLGHEICQLLLFVHAFTGCDTTSRIYGVGKGTVLKKAISDANFGNHASVFLRNSSHEEIQLAGEAIFSSVYGGASCQGLDLLRYCKFVQKVQTKKTAVLVQCLPPTSVAATYHNYRVYLQVQTWMGRDIAPSEWGWNQVNYKLTPIKSTLPAAPERLLKMIRCGCKHNCDSKRCTCKKHGLYCSAACGECHGLSCSNKECVEDTIQE